MKPAFDEGHERSTAGVTPGRLLVFLGVGAVYFAWSVASGCGKEPSRVPNQSGRSLTDDGVFDASLFDLNKNTDLGTGRAPARANPGVIVLDNQSAGGISSRLVSEERFIPGREVAAELRIDLVRRNPTETRHSLSGYSPGTPNVIVRDLSTTDLDLGFLNAFPAAQGYVQAYLPGYSHDRKTALFAFRFGPVPHSVMGFCLLNRIDGRWKVRWTQFLYFH
jgi:hypothetical protein